MKKLLAAILSLILLCTAASCSLPSFGRSKGPEDAAEIDLEMVPYGATEMINQFEAWYYVPDGGKEYDSSSVMDGPSYIVSSIIGNAPCVRYDLYPVDPPEAHWGEADPRGWGESYSNYQRVKYDDAFWIADNIFGISKGDFKKLVSDGEERELFYSEKDDDGTVWLYELIQGIGDPFCYSAPLKARKDGDDYFIVFRQYNDFPGQPSSVRGTYYAHMRKNDSYWMLLEHTENIPECFGEISDGI